MLEEMSNSIIAMMVPDVEKIPINEERPIEQQTSREFCNSGRIIQ